MVHMRWSIAVTLMLAASPSHAENVEIGDFTYAGAFRLPSGFNWGARGSTYRASGDGGRGSLIVLGSDQVAGEWAEVAIPSPGMGGFGSLPEARQLTGFVEFDGNLIEHETNPEETRAGDVTCIAPRGSQTTEKCYWNAEWWYNVGGDDYAAIGMSEADGSNPRGMWHVGRSGDPEFHGSRHGAYMFAAPPWFADWYLGGRSLIVGMTREAGCCGSSQGPTLFAFRPWDVDDPPSRADLDALALVYYPMVYPGCAGPNVGDPAECYYPDYRACDAWMGGAFVESGLRSAVAISGIKAYGDNGYSDWGPCSPWHGYHCEPLEAQIVFYSTDDLAASAAGRRRPEEVVPYQIWRPDEFMDTDCPAVGGLAFDRDGGRFFVIEKGYGDDNYAVVHVYEVEPAAEHPAPDADADVDVDADSDTDTDVDSDVDTDVDSDSDSDADQPTDTGNDADDGDGGHPVGGSLGRCDCSAAAPRRSPGILSWLVP
jgi:hypothetical protein